MFTKENQSILMKWICRRYYNKATFDIVVIFTNMLSLFHSVLKELTQENDQVLLFTPTYYRFMYTLRESKRRIIEQEFQVRDTQQGK